ncbi:sigma-54 dependent transcriptional regulator [Vitiosangium sp. GDMCC 1.1324]|uniref:sigma-54-dependent transcriptional regulator n=1 Tax=Vitiosangium sp. (strain GDMCC 1.1324) TaxID=2138576 RepID=UPI000D33715D|nr:sigma-54 dependent transcriptional regulator [Vitiosangium sp. GDMCC 1.1324]PTL84918.1 sigma-54-dependent Fis family transcriptional regulator [Vitiosangium sp. GDMCC 1.1324]
METGPVAPVVEPRPMRVLVVDDERNIRTTLRMCLEGLGCEVREAATPDAALAALAQSPADLAFVDLRLGTSSGLDLLPRLLAESPTLDVVLITAYATFDTAVEAVKRGARDYLPKPFTPAQIRHFVEKTRAHRELSSQLGNLEGQLAQSVPEATLETASPAMHAAIALVTRAAASDAAVLLRGESGTGKGVLARALHSMSARRRRQFVTVNCPTLSEQLLSSELFGHVRGAFTGAVRDQPGRVEQAEGGTLFLDEVAEMSPGLQAQLLRFLQEKQFERLGEGRTRRADVRVVAATNRDLEKDVTEGHFREDLLYRLNVIEVKLPALRERPEDILPLARRFVAFFAKAAQRPPPELSPATEKMLLAYPWPGNVRELRNAMERALIVWPAEVLEPQAFPDRIAAATGSVVALGGPHTLEEVEREHILRVMASAPTLDEAAHILGIDASTLWRKRKKYESTPGGTG